ncbi:MAG: CAP domain-containing protein [Patescibacteria group bacterium]
MFRWLKRQFVPHEINGFRPLFLRSESAITLAGALVALELVLFVLPTLYFPQYARDLNLTSVLPAVLTNLTNEAREKNSLPALAVSPILTKAAQLKADDMATKGYFAHNSPEGRNPWYWFNVVGYKYVFAGENLAVNFSDSEQVTQAWMKSPTHQANVVGKFYTEVGTGIASGRYKGRESIFVVQHYGTPKTGSAVVPKNLQANVIEASSYLERLMSSPRQATDTVLFLALAVVVGALFLTVVVKFEHQFPDLIANGVVVALIIIGFHLGNNFLSARNFETSFVELAEPAETISLR